MTEDWAESSVIYDAQNTQDDFDFYNNNNNYYYIIFIIFKIFLITIFLLLYETCVIYIVDEVNYFFYQNFIIFAPESENQIGHFRIIKLFRKKEIRLDSKIN